eukprot:gene2317-9657_t
MHGGHVYDALQFHFHFPSEHTIDGEHFAGELHIVHRRQGTSGLDDLLVVGVMLDDTDDVASPFLDKLGRPHTRRRRGDR